MKALLLAIAIAMSSAFSQGHCAANIAQIPVGLRQSYGDGTTIELACASGTPQLSSCTFRISGPSGTDTYALVTGGHRLDFYLSQYWYWPASSDHFSLAVPITCPAKELEHLPAQQRDNAECRLFLSPLDGQLLPDRVEVSAGGSVSATGLGPNNSCMDSSVKPSLP